MSRDGVRRDKMPRKKIKGDAAIEEKDKAM